ncbi:MAG: hypothetical protein ACSHX3_07700 [Litorimonas sp.]
MSTKQIIRSGLMGSAAIAALGLTACANSHAKTNQYGASSHYDYESAQSCGSSCTTGVTTPTFRPAPAPRTHYGYEGVPCTTSCGAVTTGYPTITTGSTHVTSSYPSTPTYTQETAPCPTGTTSQPDGTCLQGGSHVSSYTGSSTYTGGSSYTSGSYSSGGYASSGGVANCPAGTSMQPDGSCLQSGGSSYSSHTSSTYAAPVTSTYSSTYVAPELTTACCGPVSSSTTVYSGDAVTDTYGGYATSGSTYSSSDYLPIRK